MVKRQTIFSDSELVLGLSDDMFDRKARLRRLVLDGNNEALEFLNKTLLRTSWPTAISELEELSMENCGIQAIDFEFMSLLK